MSSLLRRTVRVSAASPRVRGQSAYPSIVQKLSTSEERQTEPQPAEARSRVYGCIMSSNGRERAVALGAAAGADGAAAPARLSSGVVEPSPLPLHVRALAEADPARREKES